MRHIFPSGHIPSIKSLVTAPRTAERMTCMKKRREKSASAVMCLAAGATGGLLTWLILLVGTSALIVRAEAPERWILPTVFVLAGAASFTGGLITGRLYVGRPIVSVGTGILLLAAIGITALLFAGSGDGTASAPLRGLLAVEYPLFSMLGGLSSRRAGQKRRPMHTAKGRR